MKRITSASANAFDVTNPSTSRMICTDITPARYFHASFQITGLWYAATYSCRICSREEVRAQSNCY